ncbi:MAG: hypothetical protein WA734_03015 [Candidatus Acidiferrales bacterium]
MTSRSWREHLAGVPPGATRYVRGQDARDANAHLRDDYVLA